MKKHLKLLFSAIFFCIAFSISVFANGVSLTVESKTVSADTDTVSVAIELNGNTGLSGLELSMSYTEGLVIKEIVRGDGLSSMSYTKPNDLTANPITLLLDAESDDSTNGILYNVVFEIPKGREKDYFVNLTVSDAYDFDFNDVDISVTNGKITVEEPLSPFTYLSNSLILDGSLGMKIYFEYDSEIVDTDTMVFNATLTNSDSTTEEELILPITLEEDGKKAHSIVYLAPKDIDNITVSSVVTAKTLDGKDVSSNDIPDVTVPAYIDTLKELAETDEECAKALDLVNALEVYCDYADKYFDKSVVNVEEIVLDKSEEDNIKRSSSPVRNPENTIGKLDFYGTSLILEGEITLRHYFKMNGEIDIDAYAVEGADGLKYSENNEGFIYIDVENVHANELSNKKTVTVSYGENDMTIVFSPLHYIALTYNCDEVKLRNLSKALYRYYVEAKSYTNDSITTDDIIKGENEIDGMIW